MAIVEPLHPAATSPSLRAQPRDVGALALGLVSAVLASGAWMLLALAPNFDNAWLQEAARRVFVHGRPFLTDALEVNPPIVVAVFAPSAWIEHATGWNGDRVFQVLGLLAGAAGALAMTPALAWVLEGRARAAVTSALAYAVLVFGATTLFGERDSLALVLSLPFLVWWCARLAGRPSRATAWSLLAAVVAAVGVLLKPTVALVPLVLVLAEARRRRSWRAAVDPHFVAMGATAGAYLLSIFTLMAGWLPVGRLGAEAYWAYAVPFARVLAAGAPDYLHALLPVALALAIPSAGAEGGNDRLRRFLVPLSLCAVAFQLSMILQGKAFVYHALPGRQLASIACAIALVGWLDSSSRRGPSIVLVALAMLGLLYAPLRGGLLVGWPVPQPTVAGLTTEATMATPLFRHLQRAGAYGPLVVLSTSLIPVWPSVAMVGAEWASRGPCDWLAPAVMQMEETGDAGRAAAAPLRKVAAGMLAEDLERWKPPVVVLRTDAPTSPRSPGNLVEFYAPDARVAAAWKDYRFEKGVENFDFWVRRGSVADHAGSLDVGDAPAEPR